MQMNHIMKKLILGVLIFSALIWGNGCRSVSNNTKGTSGQLIDDMVSFGVDLNLENTSTLLSFDGEYIWYQHLKNHNAYYYQYDIRSGITKEIGKISNSMLIGGDKTYSGDGVYLYAAIEDEDTISNVLYFLSFSNASISPVASNNISEMLIPIEYYNNQIISLKIDVNKETQIGTSILESLDLDTDASCVILEESADYGRKIGNVLLNFDLEKNKIYVYAQTSEEVLQSVIKVCDMNGTVLEEYSLSNLPTKSIRETCTGVKVHNDLIYLVSLSGEVIVGKMIDGEIQVILQDVDIDYARDSCEKGFLLYQRYTSDIFVVDEVNGAVKKLTIDLPEGEIIRQILTHGDSVLLNTRTDTGALKTYITDLENISVQTIRGSA